MEKLRLNKKWAAGLVLPKRNIQHGGVFMSANSILTQDTVIINKPELEALVERVILINAKVIEYKAAHDKLGEELRLVESHLKTYQTWLAVELNQAGGK